MTPISGRVLRYRFGELGREGTADLTGGSLVRKCQASGEVEAVRRVKNVL